MEFEQTKHNLSVKTEVKTVWWAGRKFLGNKKLSLVWIGNYTNWLTKIERMHFLSLMHLKTLILDTVIYTVNDKFSCIQCSNPTLSTRMLPLHCLKFPSSLQTLPSCHLPTLVISILRFCFPWSCYSLLCFFRFHI